MATYDMMGKVYWNQHQKGAVKPVERSFTITLGREVVFCKTDRVHLVDVASLKIVGRSIESSVRRFKIVRSRFSPLDLLAWV